jgi:hypothetical protein
MVKFKIGDIVVLSSFGRDSKSAYKHLFRKKAKIISIVGDSVFVNWIDVELYNYARCQWRFSDLDLLVDKGILCRKK